MPVIECDVEAARERLEEAGVAVDSGNTDHERWRASRGGATAVAYDDKIVIQGRTRGISRHCSARTADAPTSISTAVPVAIPVPPESAG